MYMKSHDDIWFLKPKFYSTVYLDNIQQHFEDIEFESYIFA